MNRRSKQFLRRKSSAHVAPQLIDAPHDQAFVPFDENLLERSRTQWEFGDWQSLAEIDRDALQHHPDRAKLALLAGAGCLQIGEPESARSLIRLARDWGCSKRLISQILISGVHHSLGRVAAISNQQYRAMQHFEASIAIGAPGGDIKLLAQARQMGLNTSEGHYNLKHGNSTHRLCQTNDTVFTADALPLDSIHQAWQVGRWEFLAKLDNAELAGHSNRSDVVLYAACGYQQLDDMDGLQRCMRLARAWGSPRDKLKQFLAAGIHNTLALSDTLAGEYESAAKNFYDSLVVGLGKPKQNVINSRIRRQLKTLKNINVEQMVDAVSIHLDQLCKISEP